MQDGICQAWETSVRNEPEAVVKLLSHGTVLVQDNDAVCDAGKEQACED